jgi:hypothetical protein
MAGFHRGARVSQTVSAAYDYLLPPLMVVFGFVLIRHSKEETDR